MAQFELSGWDELAAQLDRIDDTLTGRVQEEMAKAGGEVIAARARQLCPKGDSKRGKYRLKKRIKPLALLIKVETRRYDGGKVLAVVGPDRDGGQHGHLVEFGHDIVVGGKGDPKQKEGWTPELVWNEKLKTMVFKHGAPRRLKIGSQRGKTVGRARKFPFLRPAFDETKSQQYAAMEAVVARTVREIGGT